MEQDDYDEEEGEDDDYGNNYFDNGEAEDGDDGGGGGDDGECFRLCFWIAAMLIDSIAFWGEQREHIRTGKTVFMLGRLSSCCRILASYLSWPV